MQTTTDANDRRRRVAAAVRELDILATMAADLTDASRRAYRRPPPPSMAPAPDRLAGAPWVRLHGELPPRGGRGRVGA